MKKFQELATHSRKPERAKLWFSSATVLEKLCTLLQSSDCLHNKATKNRIQLAQKLTTTSQTKLRTGLF
jgi:hypothetical protein